MMPSRRRRPIAVVSLAERGRALLTLTPNIVGKMIRVNKLPYTIIGITPEGFYGTEKFLQPDIFVPMANRASLGWSQLARI